MITCHECGSEVAENDAFCPFCGISLQPVAIPGISTEDEFAATIAMSSIKPQQKSVDIPASNEQPAIENFEEAKPVETNEVSSDVESVPIEAIETPSPETVFGVPPAEKYDSVPDVDSVPVPTVLEDLEREAGHLFAVPPDTEPESAVDSEISEGDDEANSDAVIHLKEGDESDVGFRSSPIDHLPESRTDLSADEAPAEPSSVEVASASDSHSVESVRDEPNQVELEKSESEQTDEIVEDNSPADDSSPIDAGIQRPPDILETPDPYASQSMFDSVRIIDNKSIPGGPEPILTEFEKPIASQKSESGQTAAVSESLSANSYTDPNIGQGDTGGPRSAKLKPLDEGAILNRRYEIVRKIGGGGMGAVYLASDNNLGGVLRAVKEMVQSHIEESQQDKAIEDFKRESMILSSLDHASIPTIYDYFFDDKEGRFYLVMKYISGGDLAARLRSAPEGKIDEITVTEWGIQIADVLDYLHSQPTTIVYRDLKPSNVMLDGNSGRVMLIDFGIARSISQKEEKGVTAVGTMGYAPPELFSGNVEPRSDIYSLGSTMFHLLTGADPQSNPLLIFDFQKNPRPRQINPQLSDQIESFLMRCVEYNSDARFSSAAQVRQALTEHRENLNRNSVTFGVKAAPDSVGLADQAVFCGFCGQKIVATDLFCAFCGAKQPIAQKGVHSEIYGRSPVTARLVIEGTSDLQTPTFSLEKGEMLIGRRDPMSNIFPEVDLSKYDPQTKISRRHARIWREGNSFLLEDLGSSNGTMLVPIVHDPVRLSPRQPHALTNGDKIRVGDTTLHFVVG